MQSEEASELVMILGLPTSLKPPESPPPAADSNRAVLGLWYHALASLGTVWEVGYVLQSLFSLGGIVFILSHDRCGCIF